MGVVKSKRGKSKVEFFDYAYNIVENITKYLLADFGTKKSYNDLKAFCYKAKMSDEDKSEFSELVEKYHIEIETCYPEYILNYYRERILDAMGNMITCISHAYTMYPNSVYEYNIKRQYQTDAISYCYDIKHNLQLSIKIFTPNLEKYIPYVTMIDNEIDLLKQWRKDCTKLRKICYENDERLELKASNKIEQDEKRKNSDIDFLTRVLNVSMSMISSDTLINNMSSWTPLYDNNVLRSDKYIPAIYYVDANDKITSLGIFNL